MERCIIPRLPASSWLAACCLVLLAHRPTVTHASPSPADSVHYCALLDADALLGDDGVYSGKAAAEKNAGEPWTVRMIYFLPNDRPFRQVVVDTMKAWMPRLQRLFAVQMASHGYGYKTFRYEKDVDGHPLVHRVDGDHADAHYLDDSYTNVLREVNAKYERDYHVYFYVVDTSTGSIHSGGRGYAGVASGGRHRGVAFVSGRSSFITAAHEMAHAFGLDWHDFRDNTYILSYGANPDRLSACSAAFLSVTPWFNRELPVVGNLASWPTVEYLGHTQRYPAGTQSFALPWRVADPDGVHMVYLLVGNAERRGLTAEVKACRVLSGETEATVTFDYDGVTPSRKNSSFAHPLYHQGQALAVDRLRYTGGTIFSIAQESPHLLATLKGDGSDRFRSVAFSPDGGLLAAGSIAGRFRVWDVASRQEIAALATDGPSVRSVAFSPDGRILAAGLSVDRIILWEVATRREIAVLDIDETSVASVAFSPDGGMLAAGGRQWVRVWDTASWQELAVLDGHADFVRSVAFSPDGGILAAGSQTQNEEVRVWDTASWQEIAVLDRHTSFVTSVTFSPDGGMLATGSLDGTARLWDVASWQEIAVLRGWGKRRYGTLSFSPDGRILASGSKPGYAELWDVLSEEIVAEYPTTGPQESVAFSPDGAVLATASYRPVIEMWDTSPHITPASGIPDWDGDGAVGFGDFVKFAAKYRIQSGQGRLRPAL